jgi:hypothetical protein
MTSKPLGVCKLCQQSKELRRSHIIPEFMYFNMYDEKHRSLMVESDVEAGERFKQKGEREFLLCEACEGHIGTFETYSAPPVKSLLDLTAHAESACYIVSDLDYQSFKLFQMSLLWRASVASIAMFRNVSLGQHEERLRAMIHASDPGTPDEYGCMMLVMENTKYLHRIIWSPETDQIDGHPIYRFQTGRVFWYFFLPDHVVADAADYFLPQSGTLRVPKAPWPEHVVIQRLAGRIAQARNRRSKRGA